MQLTREQKLALLLDRPLAVIANAGSGKTRVLVERYFALLMRHGAEAIQSVVAITFTRAAAAEMFTRIARRLESLLADPAYKAEWRQLKMLRERLSGARISTIHSFAAQLLRDYAVEAGVPPTFRELSEYESRQLRNDVLDQKVEEVLRDPTSPFHSLLWSLFLRYRRAETERLLQSLIASSEQFEEWYAVFQQSVEELIEERDKALQCQVKRLFREYQRVMAKIFQSTEPAEKGVDRISALQGWIEQWEGDGVWQGSIAEVEAFLYDWLQYHQKVFRKNGDLRSNIFVQPPARRLINATKWIIDRVEKLRSSLAYADLDRELFADLQQLMRFLEEVVREATERRKSQGWLDFDDLQLLLLHVLDRHPQAVQELRQQIRYLMVDEFQDTNPVQYALIRKLTILEDPKKGASLFVVGDPKQSIYGFRGSDVRVFLKAQQEIERWNRQRWGAASPAAVQVGDDRVPVLRPSEWWGQVQLQASFRMLPRLAAFVNLVCAPLMEQRLSEYDVPYTPLIVARSPLEHGSITFLAAVREETNREDHTESMEEEVSEAELVAAFVRNAVEGAQPLSCGEFQGFGVEEQRRPLRYADIAILMRSRSGMETLAGALRRYHVPFVIYAGTGFYQQPEIQDIRSFLLFLHNPHDDIALASILRAPFFGVDDAVLAAIAAMDGESLWEKMGNAVRQEQQSAAIGAIYQQLQDLLTIAPRTGIPVLIRMIIERTDWRGKIAADLRREQMVANVEKLIAFAREYEQRGLVNLYDFAQELLERARFEEHEGEAEQLAGKDAVQIMTIHAAKGQEFPMVVLYNLNAATQQNNRSLFVPHPDFGGALRPAGALAAEQPETLPSLVLAQMEQEAKERAEAKRLLYVALTRAQDHLVLSSTLRRTRTGTIRKPQGMLELVLEGLELEPETLLSDQEQLWESVIEKLEADGTITAKQFTVPVAIRTRIAELPSVRQEEERQATVPPIILVQPSARISGMFVTASQLTYLAEEPELFEQQYLLGLPVEDGGGLPGIFPQPEDERDQEYGSARGEIFHYAMEHLSRWYLQSSIDSDMLRTILQYGAQRIARFIPEDVLEDVFQMVHRVMATPLIQQYGDQLLEAEMEKTLWVPYHQDFLFGRIDCVVQNAQGDFEVWDWKTVGVHTVEQMRDYFRRYYPQLLVYLVLVSQWKPRQDRFVARLLFPERAGDGVADDQWGIVLEKSREELEAEQQRLEQWYRQYRQYFEVRQ